MPTADHDSSQSEPDWEEGLSLEELGKAYAKAVGHNADGTQADHPDEEIPTAPEPKLQNDTPEQDIVASLSSIIEGALFIGHADGRSVQERELAALMRDVTEADVAEEIERLNDAYKQNQQALRILRDETGVRLGLASDMEVVRRAFYGKVREATLTHGAIEVLSLVAYQPGITAEKVQDQRGKDSGSLLNQLVRRRLLEQRRITVEGERRPIATYYPTERFLEMFGLESLDDLPQVEE